MVRQVPVMVRVNLHETEARVGGCVRVLFVAASACACRDGLPQTRARSESNYVSAVCKNLDSIRSNFIRQFIT